MTATKRKQDELLPVLEEILEGVQSVDRNVEEILERLSDIVDTARYRDEWHSPRVDYRDAFDDDEY